MEGGSHSTGLDDAAKLRQSNRAAANPDPEEVKDEVVELMQERFSDFLRNYEASTEEMDISQGNTPNTSTQVYQVYVIQADKMAEEDTTTMYLDFAHLISFDTELAEVIELEYFRFEPCLREAVREFVASSHPSYIWESEDVGRGEKRDFFISFYNLPCVERIRALRMDRIGRLLSVSGTVTRTSEVRPELLLGSFTCNKCGLPEKNVIQQFQYTKPLFCKNPACQNPNDFQLDMTSSRFVDWQRVKVQENADEIPAGSMPRTIDVILRHEIVEKTKAGDKSVFTGMFVVVPDVAGKKRSGENTVSSRQDSNAGGAKTQDRGQGYGGLKNMGVKELTYRTVFIASGVQPLEIRTGVHNVRDTPEHVVNEFTEEELNEIKLMASTPNLYENMVDSIAPSVFGHRWVKRGVLLMLLGGVHKKTPEGIKLRGDINTCIVGDPSTAKSQFLKYVHSFLPRAVYASGKGSSAAGLTASIGKDPDTGEFCVDAGSLMLADNGICCIDEFDKMDNADQVAIHEAMEQQTISITKAGIQATLNARTSILAAANPRGGRYDRTKSLRANVDLSAPILSRFDLFFVVLDECDPVADLQIAQHILNCHRKQAEVLEPPFSTSQLQRYIRYARTVDPMISAEGKRALVDCYRQLRQQDTLGRNTSCYRITVRQLESLIRLSEALARLHLDNEVRPKYVREAHRLLKTSIIHVEVDDIHLDDDDDDDDNNMPTDHFSGQSGGIDQGNDDEDDEDLLTTREHANKEDTTMTDKNKESEAIHSKPKLVIPNEKFLEMRSMLCHYMSTQEEKGGEEGEEGLKWSEVQTWYLEQREDQMSTEDEYNKETEIVNKVIQKLLKEGFLVVVGTKADTDEDTRIKVYPGIDPSRF